MKLLLILLITTSLFSFDSYEESVKRIAAADQLWSYFGYFMYLFFGYIILKNTADILFIVINKIKKSSRLKIVPFDYSSNIYSYEKTFISSFKQFLTSKLSNDLTFNLSDIKSELLKVNLSSTYSLTYFFNINTAAGYSSRPDVSFETLNSIAHEEGLSFISNKDSIVLLNQSLINNKFGQQPIILKSFSPNCSYAHTCNSCGGDGREICYYCSGSGYTRESKTRYYTDHDGREQSETVYENVTCSYCYGSGYVDCSSCNGTGHQYDYALVNIQVNETYNVDYISNSNSKLLDGIKHNILIKNLSLMSKTISQNFQINDFIIIGRAEMNLPFGIGFFDFNSKKYEIKSLGTEAEIIDVSELSEDLLNLEAKETNNFYGFFSILKQESYLKHFFKHDHNADLFKNILNDSDSDNFNSAKNKFSIKEETSKFILNKMKNTIINLRKFSAFYSLLLGISFFLFLCGVAFIRNGEFHVGSIVYLIIIPLFALIGLFYFKYRLFLLTRGNNDIFKFAAKEKIDFFDLSFTFWRK